MVWKLDCDCNERIGVEIDSIKLFEELREFFEEQVSNNIFEDIPVEIPFYVWTDKKEKIEWYATKWYRCKACECLWEFDYPDFPANGFVRKFEDGKYMPEK